MSFKKVIDSLFPFLLLHKRIRIIQKSAFSGQENALFRIRINSKTITEISVMSQEAQSVSPNEFDSHIHTS